MKAILRSISFAASFGTHSNWRDVYLGAGARGVTACGTFLATTTLVLTFQQVSGYAVAAIVLASTVPVVVLAPLAGRLADRVDSRRLLVTVGCCQVAVAAGLAAAGHSSAAIPLVALLGCGQAIINPTLAALTPSMVSYDHLPRASAINQTANMLGLLTGPAIGGVLVGAYGVTVPLVIHAVSWVAIVIAGALLTTRRGAPAPTAASTTPTDATAGSVPPEWRLRHDPLVRAAVISIAAVVATIGAFNVIDVFLIRDTLNAAPATYGLLEAIWTSGMLTGAWLLARAARRARDDSALLTGLLISLAMVCAALPLAASVPTVAWLAPLWIIAGIGNGGLNVYANVLLARRAPERARGRTYATLAATVHGAGMAGYASGGLLVEALPIRPLVAGLGIAGLAVLGMLAGPVARTISRERAQSVAVPQAAVPS